MGDVFILGAGFSKAINAAMPIMKELSNEVIARLEASAFPPHDTLYALGNDIELWMTYLTQHQPWLKDEYYYRNMALAAEIRRHIFNVIVNGTKTSMNSSAPDWLLSLIGHWHSQRASVLTLNYDTLVERAAHKIVVNDQAGILAESIHPPYFADILARSGEAALGELKTDSFLYFKLHGSTNLFYSGRPDFYGETIFMTKAPPWGTNYQSYESGSRLVSADKEVLLIPPVTDKLTYFNNETVRQLWQDASAALHAASRVFVIGYSLPPADLGITFFLQHSRPSDDTAVYVIDQNSEVVSRFKNVLPTMRVKGDYAGRADVVSDFVCRYPELPSI